jgi:hypothetical protein
VAAFAPTALLAADVSDDPEDRALPVTGWSDIGSAAVGSLAWLGGELLRLDGITAGSVTVSRGCLDTVPRAHPAGTPLVLVDDGARITETSFAAGETLAVRLLPETGRGTLAFVLAIEDRLTLDRRAIRPLPPGRLQGNGAYAPDADTLVEGDLVLTWAHRDRLSQTSPVIADYTAASIGPEPGVGYLVEIAWVDPDTGAALLPPAAAIEADGASTWTLRPEDVPEAGAPERVAEIDVAVRSRRLVEGAWVVDREPRRLRLAAPFAAGWGVAWGFHWGA